MAEVVGERVHPRTLPQKGGFPQVTYYQVSGRRERSLDGPSGLTEALLQLDIWTLREDDLPPIDRALRLCLEGDIDTPPAWAANGLMGSEAAGYVPIQDVEYEDGIDDIVKQAGPTPKVFRTAREVTILYAE